MGKLSNILFLLLTFLFIGCKHQTSKFSTTIRMAERLINVDPDSANKVLKRLPSPNKLDDETFAHWCMLSGKITDKIYTPILPSFHLTRALMWYEKNGTIEEQTQMKLYLGRSYVADGNYDKAMTIFTNALETANKNKLHNLDGYINSYMGTLYEEEDMRKQAINKYLTAANKFKLTNNLKSYACALRDAGREYAFMDSLSYALKIMHKAADIANKSNDGDAISSIDNSIGNIYMMQSRYDKAKEYFRRSLTQGRDNMPNYVALIDLYVKMDSIPQAYNLLQQMPQNNPEYTYTIKRLYHQIYKAKGNYKKSLEYLEGSMDILDSTLYAKNQSKILEIETRYNNLKAQSEINELKISKQKYIIILTLSISIALFIVLCYFFYRKKMNYKIQKQQAELNKTRLKLLDLSLDLEKKKNQLNTARIQNQNIDNQQEELNNLSLNYKNLQNNILTDSPIYKKLSQLAKQNIPRNNKTLITDQYWKLITDEITIVYPNLEKFIYTICPKLTEQEWQYCCFYMFGFDGNDEAKLLNLTPNSVRTKHVRFRQRLNVTLTPRTTLYEYIINNMS